MERKIVFANALLPAVEVRDKQITIRNGFRQYPIGQDIPVFAATGERQQYDLTPFRVTWCLAKDVLADNYFDDGFTSQEDLFEQMRTYYTDFGPETEVTVLEFERTHYKTAVELAATYIAVEIVTTK